MKPGISSATSGVGRAQEGASIGQMIGEYPAAAAVL